MARRILEPARTTPCGHPSSGFGAGFGGAGGHSQADAKTARAQVLLVGLLATVLVHEPLITAVSLVAPEFGFWPTVLVHDYGGTLITVAWLFAFWAFADRWILGAHASDAMEGAVA